MNRGDGSNDPSTPSATCTRCDGQDGPVLHRRRLPGREPVSPARKVDRRAVDAAGGLEVLTDRSARYRHVGATPILQASAAEPSRTGRAVGPGRSHGSSTRSCARRRNRSAGARPSGGSLGATGEAAGRLRLGEAASGQQHGLRERLIGGLGRPGHDHRRRPAGQRRASEHVGATSPAAPRLFCATRPVRTSSRTRCRSAPPPASGVRP